MAPVYGGFYTDIRVVGCQASESPMTLVDGRSFELGDSNVGVRKVRDELEIATQSANVLREIAEEYVVATLELGDGALGYLEKLRQLSLRFARDLLPQLLKTHLQERVAYTSLDPLAGCGAHLFS